MIFNGSKGMRDAYRSDGTKSKNYHGYRECTRALTDMVTSIIPFCSTLLFITSNSKTEHCVSRINYFSGKCTRVYYSWTVLVGVRRRKLFTRSRFVFQRAVYGLLWTCQVFESFPSCPFGVTNTKRFSERPKANRELLYTILILRCYFC
jgi:hypothetical protein